MKPQGEGRRMEPLRPTRADLAELPEWSTPEPFSRSFGAGCETEGELVHALCHTERHVGCLETGCDDGCCLVACRNGDTYPRCHERHPAYLLGNLRDDGVGCVLERFFGANPPLALAVRRRGLPELAAAYGDPAGDKIHGGCSLCRTLVARALKREARSEP